MRPGKQAAQLQSALVEAFPTRDELTRMVRHELDMHLDGVAPDADLEQTTFELITHADAHGRFDDLVRAALRANRGNPALQAFIEAWPLDDASPRNRKATPRAAERPLLGRWIGRWHMSEQSLGAGQSGDVEMAVDLDGSITGFINNHHLTAIASLKGVLTGAGRLVGYYAYPNDGQYVLDGYLLLDEENALRGDVQVLPGGTVQVELRKEVAPM